MKSMTMIAAFIGGAIVGCGAAMLFAPEKGSDARERIKRILTRKGVRINDAEVDALVAELTAAVED